MIDTISSSSPFAPLPAPGQTMPDPVEPTRPVLREYRHTPCGTQMRISQQIGLVFARKPAYYGQCYCAECEAHFPLAEFTWVEAIDQVVGA